MNHRLQGYTSICVPYKIYTQFGLLFLYIGSCFRFILLVNSDISIKTYNLKPNFLNLVPSPLKQKIFTFNPRNNAWVTVYDIRETMLRVTVYDPATLQNNITRQKHPNKQKKTKNQNNKQTNKKNPKKQQHPNTRVLRNWLKHQSD